MRVEILLFILLVFNNLAQGQRSFSGKCAPGLASTGRDDKPENFALLVADLPVFKAWAKAENVEIIHECHPANIIVLRSTTRDLAAKILPRPDVLFADFSKNEALEELAVPGHNLFVNTINAAHSAFPALDGSGIVISIKENRFDTADVDVKNRAALASNAAQQITTHANITASLVGGAGNSHPAGRGVARGAGLLSNGFNNLLPEEDYFARNVSIQNHSYGSDIENYYGVAALAYDKSVEADPVLLHVFSAGNKGPESSLSGVYANIPGYANLTGNFKMAKNVLTVGAVDSFGQVVPFSSRGPAYDGRLKPDLVAFGQDGSSGAAALVSGAAALLQQAYREQSGALPPATLIRALLLNNADDLMPPGPDFFSGFGNLNLKKAIQSLVNQQFVSGDIHPFETKTFPLDLPAGMAQLKIVLAWDDPPAAPNAPKALLNDLDLKVIAPGGGEWLPWVSSHFPHPDSLGQNPARRRDTLNNAEQVTVDLPAAGLYAIHVSASGLATDFQHFTLTWAAQQAERFNWYFPVRNDAAVAGRDVLLRWENNFADSSAQLEYRFAGSPDWQTIDPKAALAPGFYRWPTPDTFAEMQVRMLVGGQVFESDTFLIARDLRMKIGFNCPDSAALYWNAAAPGASYLLSGLGDRYLESLQQISDTFIVLQKADFPYKRFSVKAVGQNGPAGLSSPAPDIAQQGVACYFESFFATLNTDFQTDLSLRIGTAYGLRSVQIGKMQTGAFIPLQSWQPVENVEFITMDGSPQQGLNRYRVRLDLDNGGVLFSDTAEVYLLNEKEVLIFPNPAATQSRLNVIINTSEEADFVLFDVLGNLISEKKLEDAHSEIVLTGLPSGVYIWGIRKAGKLRGGGKLVIR